MPFKIAIIALAARAVTIIVKIFVIAYQTCIGQMCIVDNDYDGAFYSFNILNLVN